ncbi:MAG TPA: metallophosphoesterase [Ktedonobacterales bacterium]|nr:metallophosphoesterase [Ktedonobacterales bacterium]
MTFPERPDHNADVQTSTAHAANAAEPPAPVTLMTYTLLELPQWVIGDTHWFHVNIAAYAGRPSNHEALMIAGWRETVDEADTILHLGDVALGPREGFRDRMPSLPGHIYFLRGNHDSRGKAALLEDLDWRLVLPFSLPYRGWRIEFCHAPHPITTPRTIQVHGHLHQHPAPSSAHINVSVEQIGYRPVALQPLLAARMVDLEHQDTAP